MFESASTTPTSSASEETRVQQFGHGDEGVAVRERARAHDAKPPATPQAIAQYDDDIVKLFFGATVLWGEWGQYNDMFSFL